MQHDNKKEVIVKPRTHNKAFTLIEMAIVLVIIGLLVGLVAPIVTNLVKREKLGNSRDYVEQVKNEIIGFAIINKHLPTNGELGTKVDPYGNTLTYLPSSDMVSNDFCTTSPAPATLYTVNEQQPGGAASKDFSGVAFVLSSPGRNLADEYTVSSQVVTTYDPRAWTPTSAQPEYDDIVEYVTFNYLKNKVCSNTAGGFSPPGADTSFATDPGAFAQANVVSTTNAGGGSYATFDAATQTLTFDTDGSVQNQAGCDFYKGNLTGNCTDGLCLLRDGIRAYFKFTVAAGSNGGFTFALVGVNASESINCPGGAASQDTIAECTETSTLCGGECGYNGYADQIGTNVGLAGPKMAIEFDLYRSNGGNYSDEVFGATPAAADESNHIALDFWNTYPAVSPHTDSDDVDHEDLLATGGNDYRNPSTTNTFYQPGTSSWLEDGLPHTVRIEVHRYPSLALGGNSTWELYSWYDCGNCTDLSVDYDPDTNPGAYYTAVVSNNSTLPTGGPVPLYDALNYFRFGWTSGICGTQTVSITDFGLSFR